MANPQELALFSDDPSQGAYSGQVMSGLWLEFTYHNYEFFRNHNDSFRDICVFESNRHTIRMCTTPAIPSLRGSKAERPN